MSSDNLDIAALMAKAKAAIKEKDAAAAAAGPAPAAKAKLTLAKAKSVAARDPAQLAATKKVAAPGFLETAASVAGPLVAETLRAVTGINPVGKTPTEEELKDFYKRRKKHPERYTVDPKGNLVIRSKTGAVEKIYTIPPYRAPTTEELKELEDSRRTAVREVEGRYEEAMGELRARMDEYGRGEASAGDVVAANTRLAAIDAERHTVMFPLMEVRVVEGVDVRKVLFNERDNPGKMTVHIPMRRTMTLQEQYVREGDEVMPEAPVRMAGGAAVAEVEEVAAGHEPSFSQTLANDKGIIAFANPEDNEHGYLSTFWPVNFKLGSTAYFTVEQAVAAEKARAFHEDALRTEILRTRAPRTMRTKANGIIPKSPAETGGMPVPRLDEWENDLRLKVLKDATLAKFRQNPELADKLILTGDKTLVLADTREKKDGIGLALTDPKIANSAEWRGGNLYGKILMEVRSALRDERGGGDGAAEGGATEETISEVAYARERERSERGAVIYAMQRRMHF